MSLLNDAKLPSLKDKIDALEEEAVVGEVERKKEAKKTKSVKKVVKSKKD